MNIRPVVILLIILSKSIFADPTYYVDPGSNGNDNNSGTITQPFKTITKAINTVGSTGGYIYLRGGIYNYSTKLSLTKIATASSTIKIWAFSNELPIIDFTGEASGDDGFSISGNYYHLKGLEVMHSPHNAIKITGNNNIIEACKIHSNGNTGLQIGSQSGSTFPSNNLILNCDSYLNYDAPGGGNADGFGAKWNTGTGNVFKGCRSWQNSDDGWDLWEGLGSIEIDSCFSFRNGQNPNKQPAGNGNGFKIGGGWIATPHIVKNCVAFDNRTGSSGGKGFDQNHNTAGQTLYNCVSYRNQNDNFSFPDSIITGQHIIKNCISYSGTVTISNATLSNNSWPSLTPTATDFISLDTSLASAPRQLNGNLPDNGFFRLKAGSKFIDAGVNVGIPFNGGAPDIGAFEYIPIILNFTLNLTAFIEGPTNSGGTAMRNDFWPLAVTVELNSSVSPYALVEAKTGNLSTSGVGTFTFTKAADATPYYIVVKSANTIETWSATAQSFTAGSLSYNFSTAAEQAFGSNMVQKGSTWCIFSGDVSKDATNIVDGSDVIAIDNDNTYGVTDNPVTDITGDGIVDGSDVINVDNNNTYGINRQAPSGAAIRVMRPGLTLRHNNK
jgi:pectate disaccharide-lyase